MILIMCENNEILILICNNNNINEILMCNVK